MAWMKWLPTAALLVCLTAGCQTDTGGPPVSPTPTGGGTSAPTSASSVPTPEPTCTPDGARYPEARSCSEEERAEQVRLDELEAEAMQVYQEFWDEWVRQMKAGGSPEPSDYMKERASGPFLEGQRLLLRDMHDGRGELKGELTTVAAPARGLTFQGSEVALIACMDGSGTVTTYEDDGESYPGKLTYWTLSLRHDPTDGRLKIDDGEPEEVNACPISD
ncbi:hypothetical protein [Parenemella sanctibonifatiensis]|uniref:Lipoprotein n=1 Tax=Parenemella sanctibonifatiensis TaxID=2016505 RepID=A0A255EJ38_9ACTN|nr:hypothetical protein [Parenemella sanctibonifatiensis]OYN91537.1 hypothetical protein CGZ92_00375 [Parenemella sanctibonifatiensis]